MITIATSIRYGNYKHLFNKAVGVERLIQKYWNDFRIKFEFDTRDKFLIRPIKGNTIYLVMNKQQSQINIIRNQSESFGTVV